MKQVARFADEDGYKVPRGISGNTQHIGLLKPYSKYFRAKEIVTRPSLCRVYDDAGAMQEAVRFANEQRESDGTYNWSKQITAFTITHSCTMGYHPTVATSEAVAEFKCCSVW